MGYLTSEIIMDTDNGKHEEELRARIEKQLSEIETGEILQDMTKMSLEEKGFIGDKPVSLSLNIPRQETEKEHLLFEENVDYERLPDDTDVEQLDAEPLLHLRDVTKGRVLATRKQNEPIPFANGINVILEVSDKKEMYYSTATGKVVIIKDKLHVIPVDRDCSLTIRIDETKMEVSADFIPGLGDGKALTPDTVVMELKNSGVVYGIDHDVIRMSVDEAETTKKTISDVPVASGHAPSRGEGGRIEYTFDSEHREYDFRILPDGRIDYHTSKNIIMVEKDQLLARILQPSAGQPGTNVFSETVPAETGIPANLVAGNGVRLSSDGTELYADRDGSVLINGSLIEVVNTYVVNGDVDFSTGNIVFNGNVVINGNVPDGFEVKADGDIIVAKIVESARLEAGRDIIIRGGIQGKGKGLISAGREIHTTYAQNARLEAQGDIRIDNFIINSYVFTSRNLVMKERKGSIIGGEVFAQRDIDVKVLGSESGIKTMVEAGTNFLVIRKMAELDEAIMFCENNGLKIEASLKDLYGRIKEGKVLDKALKEVVARAIEKKNDLEQRRRLMLARRTDLEVLAQEKEACFIKVSQICHPDVHIKIKESKTIVSKPRMKVRFYEDRKTGEIVSGAY